jgi:tetratricopeptide (TPR) repeat protein
VDQRLVMASEIIGLAEEAGNRETALYGHCQRHTALLELGDTIAAEPEFEAHARLAEETRHHVQMWHTMALRAMRALRAGSLEEAEQLAQQAMAMGQAVKAPLVLLMFGVQMFGIRSEQGRLAEMEAVWNAEQNPQFPAVRAGLAFLYSQLGREGEARAEFERVAADDFAGLLRDANWLTAVASLSQVCAFLGDARRAAVLYRSLLPYAARHIYGGVNVAYSGSVSGHLGLLATTMGRWEDAERHFEDALAANARMGARPWVAHTQLNYAKMLLARDSAGDRERALALLDEALDAAQEMGMKKVIEDCLALQQRA